jgi:hypothetical protein
LMKFSVKKNREINETFFAPTAPIRTPQPSSRDCSRPYSITSTEADSALLAPNLCLSFVPRASLQ